MLNVVGVIGKQGAAPTDPRPFQGALHLALLLVGLNDLGRHPGQEVLEIRQEVRLVPPQLGPQTAHLSRTDGSDTTHNTKHKQR